MRDFEGGEERKAVEKGVYQMGEAFSGQLTNRFHSIETDGTRTASVQPIDTGAEIVHPFEKDGAALGRENFRVGNGMAHISAFLSTVQRTKNLKPVGRVAGVDFDTLRDSISTHSLFPERLR